MHAAHLREDFTALAQLHPMNSAIPLRSSSEDFAPILPEAHHEDCVRYAAATFPGPTAPPAHQARRLRCRRHASCCHSQSSSPQIHRQPPDRGEAAGGISKFECAHRREARGASERIVLFRSDPLRAFGCVLEQLPQIDFECFRQHEENIERWVAEIPLDEGDHRNGNAGVFCKPRHGQVHGFPTLAES